MEEIQLEEKEVRSVSGKVLHEGEPVPGARVGLFGREVGWNGRLDGLETCDAEGSFQLKGIPSGRFYVVAWGPGFTMARSEPVVVPLRGNLEGVLVTSLPGKDFLAKIQDAQGNPVSDAKVEIEGSREPPFATVARSDPSGTVRLPLLPPGEHELRIESIDEELHLHQKVLWTGEEVPPTLTLQPKKRL